jgi:hypothetical protein
MFVAGFEEKTFMMRLGSVIHMKLCPKVAIWYCSTLVVAAIIVINIKIIYVHYVFSFCGAGVVSGQAFGNGRLLRSCLALITWLNNVTAFEKEALHMIMWLV